MIKNKKELKEFIKDETERLNCGILKYIPFNISEEQILYKHIVLLRKCEYYTNTDCKILSKYYLVRLKSLQFKYGMNIPINTCAKGLRIAHVGPIIINPKAIIGERCTLHIGVNIGEGNVSTGTGVPIIGDDVWIGPGAKLFNSIAIANHITVGANAVVNKSFKTEGIIIVGVPAKEVSKGI